MVGKWQAEARIRQSGYGDTDEVMAEIWIYVARFAYEYPHL